MTAIHKFAIIEEGATIGKNVRIGPFSVIGCNVVLEDNVIVHENVSIKGHTRIGSHNELFPFSAVGLPPQDLKHGGDDTRTVIGSHCKIREHVTIHAGTTGGGGVTSIGDHCLLMVGAHIAHDCRVGHHVVMANCSTLAGHVSVGNYSIIGGLSAILQFVKIGRNAMIGGLTGVRNNVPPYAMVVGEKAKICGINVIGLKRHGFSNEDIRELRCLYDRVFFSSEGTFLNRLDWAKKCVRSDHGKELISFLSAKSKKNVCQPKGV